MILTASLLAMLEQAPSDAIEYKPYLSCLRSIAISDPPEKGAPTIVSTARAINRCATERRDLLTYLIAHHLEIDPDYGEMKAERELDDFDIETARRSSITAHQLPSADDRRVFGFTERIK